MNPSGTKFLTALSLLFPVLCLITGCGPVVKNSALADKADFQGAHMPSYPLPEYRIEPGDTLDIKFFYNPELNELLIPVRPDGRISLQLVGEVTAAGQTPVELTKSLEEKYSVELKKPQVTIIVRSFGTSQAVFVDGEVNGPKLINIITPMTVMQAISQAGGFKMDTARQYEVIVIRRGPDHKPIIQTVNLEKAIDGTDMAQDIFLRPFDIVFVPRTPIANANLWVRQYIRGLIPVNFGYVTPGGLYIGGSTY
jgi:protein involved in polysaccharide export with SLBB domain